jgi:hypothetical protein
VAHERFMSNLRAALFLGEELTMDERSEAQMARA